MSKELPSGWVEVKLGVLTTKIGSGATPRGGNTAYNRSGTPLIRSMNVHFEGFRPEGLVFLNAAQAATLAGVTVHPDDVLLNITGASIGRVTLAPPHMANARVNQHVCIIRTGERLLARYLALYLASSDLQAWIKGENYGVTRPALTKNMITELRVFLPPLAEQRRIVARIEALFARIRRARADLERITPLSTRYAEQSRRRAFDQDATWPIALPDRRLPEYIPPVRFDELRNLPPGWRWAEMSTVGSVAGGITKNQGRSGQPLEMPYLRVANVYADRLRVDDVAAIQVTHAEFERVRLQPGDLLIVEGNGSVEQIGRVAVWDGSIVPCGHQNHLIRIRPAPGIPPRFLLHWLMSPYGRSILETVASSSSGLHTLSLSKIAAVPTPVAPTLVADIVANTLDERLRSVRAMQADATRALALLDHLEQIILTRAFRGELASYDPADKPARLPPAPIAVPRCRRAAPSAAAP